MGARALVLLAAAWIGVARPAEAQRPGPAAEPWFDSITAHGFAETSYSFNFGHPDSGQNQLRVFDFDDRELKLDVAELVVQRPASSPGEIGFRFDAVAGQTIPRVSAASGLFRDSDTGEAEDYDLQQIYVGWVAPLGRGLRIEAGKFVTPFGYEVIDGYDGYNDNQSRSFLFGSAIPFTHTGLRVGYEFTDAVSATLLVVQGWDDWHDNNSGKSIGAQFAFKPSDAWSLWITAMGGPEQKDNNENDRLLYEVTSTWKASDELTLGLDAVYGTEQGLLAGGGTARWSGAAAYFRCDFSDTFALALRSEAFADSDGARTGTAQTLKSLTLTPERKLGKHVVLRGDLRHDWSNENAFEDHSDLVGSQTTASVALLVTF